MSAAPRRQLGSLVYVVVLAGLATGIACIAFGPWRLGAEVCGGSMVGGGLSRLVIPDRMSGLLRVRRRTTDAVLMTALGVALLALAVLIPRQP